jgi:hypothetical protein
MDAIVTGEASNSYNFYLYGYDESVYMLDVIDRMTPGAYEALIYVSPAPGARPPMHGLLIA